MSDLRRRAMLGAALAAIVAPCRADDGYHDYLYRFPVAGLSTALKIIVALGLLPENMLGQGRDNSGALAADPTTATWRGGQGVAALAYTDQSGATVNVPARGDPAYYYVAVRTTVDIATLGIDPAAYGMSVCDPAESLAVLGAWQ